MQDARCNDRSIVPWSALTQPDIFYPDVGSASMNQHKFAQSVLPAKRICAMCPVRRECLTYAYEYEEGREEMINGTAQWRRRLPFGVWGGHSAQERHRKNIEHKDDCKTQKCRPPCRPIPERVALLEDLFQFKLSTLLTRKELQDVR